MRDIVSCFSENAIDVSHPSCSSYSNTKCIIPSQTPSLQNAVTSVYKIVLSNQNRFLVKVTWYNNNSVQGLSIGFGDNSLSAFKLNINSRLFRKKKGTKVFDSCASKAELFWDLSNAKFDQNPEPVEGFYLVLTFDSEIALVLGDMADDALMKKIKTEKNQIAKACLVSRQEHCSWKNTLYSTKARFCETGVFHEIQIKCSGENDGLKHPVLLVSIDKKTVIRVKRLQWNFRGNQTIFVDGLVVDLLWDVHDWFFNHNNSASSSNSTSSSSGCYAVFMFRTRSGMDSRLWLEEKLAHNKDQHDGLEFSLLIYACKSLQ
ncbi:hypothetical protein TIFTF001_025372 [Ficus carica]|uniref:DUF868 family protein n=1 Tax=Ficus carica TaxID=3494 RepID=A0AA88AP26_FICCA|nr:hypothetical protein TIFTF001_025372 [Ficus carica]